MTARAIKLDPGRNDWPADEVVWLTADALYEFTEEPDPVVRLRKLRKFGAPGGPLHGAGQPLTSEDLDVVARACAAVGLPELPEAERYKRWKEYIEAANDGAKRRGWWIDLPQIDDPHADERQLWRKAADSHRNDLTQLIDRGEITAHFAIDRVPYTRDRGRPLALDRLILARSEVVKFAKWLRLDVLDPAPTVVPPTGAPPVVADSDSVPASVSATAPTQSTTAIEHEPLAPATDQGDEPEAQVEAASARRVEELPARIPLMKRNEEAVLVALRNAGYEPMELPFVNGTKCPAKQAAGEASQLEKAVFGHAWKALTKAGRIARKKGRTASP